MSESTTNDLTPLEPTVFIVDDDEAVRESLGFLIGSVGLRVETYGEAESFMSSCQPDHAGCILVDVRMPGMSGLELQKELKSRTACPPVIIITGHGDVEMAVHAMKSGAYDFIEKPFNDEILLDLVQKAVADSVRSVSQRREITTTLQQMDTLTPRELEVLGEVTSGSPNKEIAHVLSISEKTVEAHRAKVMEKMAAKSLADLVKRVVAASPES